MKNMLAHFFAHDLRGMAPEIVQLEEPIKIACMSMETDVKRVYRDVPKLGKRYEAFKKEHEIPNRKVPWAFAAVSQDYDEETGIFKYALGDVVTSFENLPPGLIALEIPATKYAVFPVRPKNRFGWGIAIGRAKKYAYESWLPHSKYQPGRLIDDFEYHDQRSKRARDPEIDLYICISDKVLADSGAG